MNQTDLGATVGQCGQAEVKGRGRRLGNHDYFSEKLKTAMGEGFVSVQLWSFMSRGV